jgi:hypothetical protein
MFYPGLVDGAFPMSCNLLVQCEPDYSLFEGDAELRERQRAVPIAHVHGETDPLVEFASGLYCYERMQDGGIEALRLFRSPSAGHMFALLPVEEAVRWLEAASSDDVGALLDFAERALRDEEHRDAGAALLRARRLGASGAQGERLDALAAKLDDAALREAEDLEKAIARNADGAWVEDFWEFRRRFAHSVAAERVLELYAKLREEHEQPADELFDRARGEQDRARRDELRREIVERYYASKWYKLVQRWLE